MAAARAANFSLGYQIDLAIADLEEARGDEADGLIEKAARVEELGATVVELSIMALGERAAEPDLKAAMQELASMN